MYGCLLCAGREIFKYDNVVISSPYTISITDTQRKGGLFADIRHICTDAKY